jgi:uncharacterized protein
VGETPTAPGARASVAVTLEGETIELLPERGAYWPARRTLLVADLHLGKEHAFGAAGIGVPSTVLAETLDRLARCVVMTGAERVLILGDLLHARSGTTPEVVGRVAEWRSSINAALLLVPGNHDRGVEAVCEAWGIALGPERLEEPPFRFTHVPPERGDASLYTIAGHLHPAVRLGGGADSLRLPCFRVGRRCTVLPAFSRFTGRTAADFRPGDRLYALTETHVLPVDHPLPRRSPPRGGR